MKIEEAVETAEYWVGKNKRTHGGDVAVCLLQEVKSLRERIAELEQAANDFIEGGYDPKFEFELRQVLARPSDGEEK